MTRPYDAHSNPLKPIVTRRRASSNCPDSTRGDAMRYGLLALALARELRERPEREPWRALRHPALEPRKRPLTRRTPHWLARAMRPRPSS
jgi:hypothetical protein